MSLFFESPSWILLALACVLPSILFFLGLLYWVRKHFSTRDLQKNHDVAGFTFSIIGVLYSVILGFTVINVQNHYNDVLQTLHTEATVLADLYEDAGFFSLPDRDAIRLSLRNYVNYVVNEEWGQQTRKGPSYQTHQVMGRVWDSYYNVSLDNEKISIWYTESISKLNNFLNARLTREFSAWEHLSPMIWSLLIVGAIITICFMFFFGLENLHSQMAMTALLAGYLSFMLYLVYSLDHVYTGPAKIKPVAFEQVSELFDRWDDLSSR